VVLALPGERAAVPVRVALPQPHPGQPGHREGEGKEKGHSLIDEALSANAAIANDYDRSRRGATDAKQAKRFYGDLFGWRYTLDPNSEGKYHLVSYPGADTPSGGIFDTGGEFPNHAIFIVMVQDVAAVCVQVERLGGKVLVPPTTSKDGLVFVDLHDPAASTSGSSPRRPRRRPAAPQTRTVIDSWRSRTCRNGVRERTKSVVRSSSGRTAASRWRPGGAGARPVMAAQANSRAVVTNCNLEMNAIRLIVSGGRCGVGRSV
jgi:predicted enzyme related to lactoylglutathione lyase